MQLKTPPNFLREFDLYEQLKGALGYYNDIEYAEKLYKRLSKLRPDLSVQQIIQESLIDDINTYKINLQGRKFNPFMIYLDAVTAFAKNHNYIFDIKDEIQGMYERVNADEWSSHPDKYGVSLLGCLEDFAEEHGVKLNHNF